MIVEDNADLRNLYEQAVRLDGHKALTAANGQEALFILRGLGGKPDLILLDLMMPIMSGWEFLREREQDAALSAIPVVVCSATRDRIPENTRFLRKPLDIDDISKLIAEFCA